MRHDDPSLTSRRSSTPGVPVPARVRSLAWPLALVAVLVLTSFAVASVSAWLVPPYLALMAWILLPARSERVAGSTLPDQGPGPSLVDVEEQGSEPAESEVERRLSTELDPAPAVSAEDLEGPQDASFDSSSLKARRGKGRARKARGPVVEPPAEAVWIRVGPGKFVRADGPSAFVEPTLSTSDPEALPTAPTLSAEPEQPGYDSEPAPFPPPTDEVSTVEDRYAAFDATDPDGSEEGQEKPVENEFSLALPPSCDEATPPSAAGDGDPGDVDAPPNLESHRVELSRVDRVCSETPALDQWAEIPREFEGAWDPVEHSAEDRGLEVLDGGGSDAAGGDQGNTPCSIRAPPLSQPPTGKPLTA